MSDQILTAIAIVVVPVIVLGSGWLIAWFDYRWAYRGWQEAGRRFESEKRDRLTLLADMSRLEADRQMEADALRAALRDAIRCPMNIVPDSAKPFVGEPAPSPAPGTRGGEDA